ncbi:MAG: ATP-binding protein [Bacteroidetes bacterium]|nr:ATP-binding protein [Bacteroidota bacterium]
MVKSYPIHENELDRFVDPTGERGETPYFHGRVDIISDFESILSDACISGKGTIHLIHGAPGAGKSALVGELQRVANARGWKSVEIDPPALWDIDILREFFPTKNIFHKIDAKVRAGMGMFSIELGAHRSYRTIRKILLSSKRPLLLILDEAQMLGSSNKPVDTPAMVASNVLKALHNGKMGHPIILLTAGLRTTLSSLKALDISRFGARNRVELGPLSKVSARAVIHDWIVKDAMAKGDPTEWINAIAKEAGVWPRHVHSYSWNAAKYLKENGGVMTSEGLKEVMERAWNGRINYYEQRIDEFYVDEIKHVSIAISEYHAGDAFDRLDLPFIQTFNLT